MKKVVTLLITTLVLVGISSVCSLAQEPTATNFIVFEEFVEPADVTDYLAVQKEVKKLWDKHNLSIPVFVYRNDESAFYYVVPLSNFASIDTLFKAAYELSEKMKSEDNFDGDQKFKDLYTSRSTIIKWMTDLSYHPSGNFIQTPELPYMEWTFVYLKSGHEKEAAEAIKKYIEFYDSIDESYEWDIYNTVIGHDLPMWIFMTRSESKMAQTKLESELMNKYRQNFNELWKDMTEHVRKIETVNGWFLPNLSNVPER